MACVVIQQRRPQIDVLGGAFLPQLPYPQPHERVKIPFIKPPVCNAHPYMLAYDARWQQWGHHGDGQSGLKATNPPLKRVHELVDIGDHRTALVGFERGHRLQFRLAHGRDRLVAVALPSSVRWMRLTRLSCLLPSKRSRPWEASALMTLLTVWRGSNVYAQISRCEAPPARIR